MMFPRFISRASATRCAAAIACLLMQPCTALADDARTVIIPPNEDRAYDDWHYAPATRVGDTVYVSGIPAGPGSTYEERVEVMFRRLERTLEAAGASMADVVEIVTYHVEAKDSAGFQKEFEVFSKVHARHFTGHYPSWTAIAATALLAPGAPVEMKATAVIGSGRNVKVQRAAAAK